MQKSLQDKYHRILYLQQHIRSSNAISADRYTYNHY